MLTLEHLAALVEAHRAAAGVPVEEFSLRGRALAGNHRPAIMGVVNLSADSWYRESVCLSAEAAIARGRVLAAQGADLIDLGAESTLAHAARADDALQNSRLLPVIRELHAAGVLVSVETYSPAVTRASLEAGASVVNLTGTEATEEIYRMVAAHEAACRHLGRTSPLLYCRVDLLPGPNGPVVVELEATEPSLFLSVNPPTADRLAEAIVTRLEREA